MKIENQDRIDDYLLDRMSDEERTCFEADSANDVELKEQLVFTETVQQATKSRNEKLAAMEEWKNDYEWEEKRHHAAAVGYRATGSGDDYAPNLAAKGTPSKPQSSPKQLLYWISGIAAAFVVGFFLIRDIYFLEETTDDMPSRRIEIPKLRAGSDNADIWQLLSQRKYEDALALIKEKNLAVKEDSLDIVQDKTMDAERKEYDMQFVKDKQDELKWLKAHALLGLGHQESAISILDELRNEEGYYQMPADSLYNYIKK